jgi:citrate lyase gamma subunit
MKEEDLEVVVTNKREKNGQIRITIPSRFRKSFSHKIWKMVRKKIGNNEYFILKKIK